MLPARTPAKRLFFKAVRLFLKAYFRLVHSVEVRGRENLPATFRKLIIVSNHASLFDGIVLWTYLEYENLKIIVDRTRAGEWLLKPFMQNSYTVQIDSMNPYALKGVIDEVNGGTPLLIFPEGRITRTGRLMKVYEGSGFVASMTGAPVVPIHIKGSYETVLSRKPRGRRIFAPVEIIIGPVERPVDVSHVAARARKRIAARRIYDMLCRISYSAHNQPSTLAREFVRVCRVNGRRPAYRDITKKEVTYSKALTGAFALGRCVAKNGGKRVGILLPNLVATAMIFFGLQLFRRCTVLVNYSSGPESIDYALRLADVDLIVTSRSFLERIKLDARDLGDRKILFLEDLPSRIGLADRLVALIRSTFVPGLPTMEREEEKETAVVLFTSGSEGRPKGVCLSHENILANIWQCLSRADIGEDDYFLNALPMFHSFGLTMGTILPLFAGSRTFLYVSPLHYRVVPEIIYDQEITIFLGTGTFLRGYARKAHPYDFYALRYIFAGAEPLSDAVFTMYSRDFGVRILTGYGATECSPVISLNTALDHEYGTVGRVLPGMEYKILPVEGIGDLGGRKGKLYVRGKNVMTGYLKNETANRKFLIDDDGWYDTGDIVEESNEGFLRIVGRLKRFSKVSGEMVSLTAVEEALRRALGERTEVAVVAVADESRGERLILVTTRKDLTLGQVREFLRAEGIAELAFPRDLVSMRELPKLGTGKIDYITLGRKVIEGSLAGPSS